MERRSAARFEGLADDAIWKLIRRKINPLTTDEKVEKARVEDGYYYYQRTSAHYAISLTRAHTLPGNARTTRPSASTATTRRAN